MRSLLYMSQNIQALSVILAQDLECTQTHCACKVSSTASIIHEAMHEFKHDLHKAVT